MHVRCQTLSEASLRMTAETRVSFRAPNILKRSRGGLRFGDPLALLVPPTLMEPTSGASQMACVAPVGAQ